MRWRGWNRRRPALVWGVSAAVGGDGDLDDEEAGGGLREGGGGSAVGPAAAEGDVDAEAELAAFGLSVADVVEHVGPTKGSLMRSLAGRREPGVDEG